MWRVISAEDDASSLYRDNQGVLPSAGEMKADERVGWFYLLDIKKKVLFLRVKVSSLGSTATPATAQCG